MTAHRPGRCRGRLVRGVWIWGAGCVFMTMMVYGRPTKQPCLRERRLVLFSVRIDRSIDRLTSVRVRICYHIDRLTHKALPVSSVEQLMTYSFQCGGAGPRSPLACRDRISWVAKEPINTWLSCHVGLCLLFCGSDDSATCGLGKAVPECVRKCTTAHVQARSPNHDGSGRK